MSEEKPNPIQGSTESHPTKADNSISVIVTFCNDDVKYIRRCLCAIVWQLAPEDELIVVKDYPDSYSAHWWDSIPRSINLRRLVQTNSWKGIGKARNTGAARATCRWLKFMDVDDVLAPFALEAVRRTPIGEEIKVVRGGQTTILNGFVAREIVPSLRNHLTDGEYPILQEVVFQNIMIQNPALVSECVIDREAFVAAGTFDEKIDWEEEWDLWLRIHQKYGASALAGIASRLCYYWIDSEERKQKKRRHEVDVEGGVIDIHEYLRRTYPGCNPGGKFT